MSTFESILLYAALIIPTLFILTLFASILGRILRNKRKLTHPNLHNYPSTFAFQKDRIETQIRNINFCIEAINLIEMGGNIDLRHDKRNLLDIRLNFEFYLERLNEWQVELTQKDLDLYHMDEIPNPIQKAVIMREEKAQEYFRKAMEGLNRSITKEPTQAMIERALRRSEINPENEL